MNTPGPAEAVVLAAAAREHLASRAQAAPTRPVLGFTIANETASLVAYRQAAVLWAGGRGRLALATASGLTQACGDSPYGVWLERFAQALPRDPGCHRIDLERDAPPGAEGWDEWLPAHLALCTMHDPQGGFLGSAIYARDQAWSDDELSLLQSLHGTYAYCAWALQRQQGTAWPALKRLLSRGRARWLVLAAVAALCVPVRQTALAPAEVAAWNARVVAAPQEGVVGAVAVQPNQAVRKGDLLFSLDPSALAARRDVAAQALAVARADALVAQQRAFDDARSKAELATALGRVKEKEAELAAIDMQAARVEVRADADGVVVFTDANEWLGRPVQVGERVMQLADPRDVGIVAWLPANDALSMQAGAPVRLYLHSRPLDALDGALDQTSYQPMVGPDGVAAFRLRARLDAGQTLPHVGLRGTARIAGEQAPLGLYLLRRPIATLRVWTGL